MRYKIQHNNVNFTAFNLASAKYLRVYVYVQLYGYIDSSAIDDIVKIMAVGTTPEDILDAIGFWETYGIFVPDNNNNDNIFNVLPYKTVQDLLIAAGFTRKLSVDELSIATKWFENNCDAELLSEARQRTINRTGKSNILYIDKMLQKWEQQGIRTTEDLECIENDEINKALKTAKSAQKQTLAESNK